MSIPSFTLLSEGLREFKAMQKCYIERESGERNGKQDQGKILVN